MAANQCYSGLDPFYRFGFDLPLSTDIAFAHFLTPTAALVALLGLMQGCTPARKPPIRPDKWGPPAALVIPLRVVVAGPNDPDSAMKRRVVVERAFRVANEILKFTPCQPLDACRVQLKLAEIVEFDVPQSAVSLLELDYFRSTHRLANVLFVGGVRPQGKWRGACDNDDAVGCTHDGDDYRVTAMVLEYFSYREQGQILAHEFGHCRGLGHSQLPQAVMNAYYGTHHLQWSLLDWHGIAGERRILKTELKKKELDPCEASLPLPRGS